MGHFLCSALADAVSLVFEFQHSESGGWLSVTIAILFALTVYFVQRTGGMPFGPFWFRKFLSDYAFALSAIWWTGFAHMYVLSLGLLRYES